MKLKKLFAGEYEMNTNVDGCEVRVEVSLQDYNGFSYDCYVNDILMSGDGFTGLRLGDIKQMLGGIVEGDVKEYKLDA
tara:strand:- start:310 stop:543 length:234 start_codon:yes stop_codon:yes gene_type:complete